MRTEQTIPMPIAHALAAILCAGSIVAADVASPDSPGVEMPSTVRLAYVGTAGNIDRTITSSGTVSSGDFTESALSLAWTGPLRNVHPALPVDWAGEAALEYGQGKVGNTNGSTGSLDSFMAIAGLGPLWVILDTADERIDVDLCAFGGLGYADYSNAYTTISGVSTGETRIDAAGFEASYGLKLQARWIWTEGWGESLSLGLVRRHIWLSGDTSTRWNNSTTVAGDYQSVDVIDAMLLSFSIERRF